jgi:DNA polymerase-3 subunit epsilon
MDHCRQPTLTTWLEAAQRLAPGTLVDTAIIAADLELTGLDPKTARIVSIGWTEISGGRIHYAANRHLVVRPEGGVGASATIHELRDQDLAGGVPISEALEELFTAAQGKLFLFHHAPLDAACLQAAAQDWAGCRPPLPSLDTLRQESERRSRRGQPIGPGELRLGALRDAYGLPEHALHNALGDALATAELFLAMTAHAGGRASFKLAPLVRWL